MGEETKKEKEEMRKCAGTRKALYKFSTRNKILKVI